MKVPLKKCTCLHSKYWARLFVDLGLLCNGYKQERMVVQNYSTTLSLYNHSPCLISSWWLKRSSVFIYKRVPSFNCNKKKKTPSIECNPETRSTSFSYHTNWASILKFIKAQQWPRGWWSCFHNLHFEFMCSVYIYIYIYV